MREIELETNSKSNSLTTITNVGGEKPPPWEKYPKRQDQQLFIKMLEEGLTIEQVTNALALLGIQPTKHFFNYGLRISRPEALVKMRYE